MKKKTLLIVIDNLKRGGAEILLAGILAELHQWYSIALITLTVENDFPETLKYCDRHDVLGYKNKFSLIGAARRLKKLIRQIKPDIIHAHLFISSLLARLACRKNIPLFYTLHSQMSKDIFDKSKLWTFVEKHSIASNHSVIAVSETVLKDYRQTIQQQQPSYVLKNYISDEFFEQPPVAPFHSGDILKLVAVGNIKPIKNYSFLVKALGQLKNEPVSLEIYGSGSPDETNHLQEEIRRSGVHVSLKGSAAAMAALLPEYHVLVTSSYYEGFGLSVVEGMAVGLPVLLSDLPVLHEVTHGNALFFDPHNVGSFVQKIKEILNGQHDIASFSRQGIRIAEHYRKQAYLAGLFAIYDKALI